MCVHPRVKWNEASAEIEGDVGDELELEHWNEDDPWDEIVVVRAGSSKLEDDVGTDIQNPSPWKVYRPAPAGAY
jgi:hypothetical protein